MRELKIDIEFRNKIPPLTDDEFQKLEENILADGEIREPIVVWNGTIVDGHNRWMIIQKHPEIKPPKIVEMNFPDKWAAIVWMCRNQLGRRNVTEAQKMELMAQQFEAQKKTTGAPNGNRNAEKQFLQSEGIKKRSRGTAEIIAKENNVPTVYVERSVRFSRGLNAADEVSPGFKNAVLSGEIKAPKYAIAAIRNMDDTQKKEAVKKIKAGEPISTKQKLKPQPKPTGNRYNGGGTKEYRELRESIEEIVSDMYNADKEIVYGVDELIDDIRVNAEVYVGQLQRMLDIHSDLLTGQNKQIVAEGIKQYVFKELEKVVEHLR